MSDLSWWRIPGERRAHAFLTGPGWLRSACLSVHWSVRLVRGRGFIRRCPDCMAALTVGLPVRPAMEEAEARAAWGDR